jgi:hypothetical protein
MSEPGPNSSQSVKSAGIGDAIVRTLGIRLVENAFRGSTRSLDPESDIFDPANFDSVKNSWWLDRMFPGSVLRYLFAAGLVCTVVWIVGLVIRLIETQPESITEGIWAFIADKHWQLQPLLLFVHFVCLRLFKGIYGRNFDRAFRHLDVRTDEFEGYKRWFLGQRVNFFALAVAAPFVIWDFVFFATGEQFYETIYGAGAAYLTQIDTTTRTAEAWLLFGIWTFEWMMFGYYCVLMLTGSIVIRGILKRHDFVDSVDLVLTERQYRPMFNVIAQAGSLVFFYGLIHLVYMLYTKGTPSDVAGLIVLVVLLVGGFAITWSAVRGELKGNVQTALDELEKSYRAAREKLATMVDGTGIADDVQRIQVQLKMQLALQQLDYLQTKYENLGRRELLGMAVRILAPVGGVVARVIRWGTLAAAIGLGSAAIFGGRDQQPPDVERQEGAGEAQGEEGSGP